MSILNNPFTKDPETFLNIFQYSNWYMFLLKVSDKTRIQLSLIKEGLSIREGRDVSFNYVIQELLKIYEREAKKQR